jgi:HEAT repeat protein
MSSAKMVPSLVKMLGDEHDHVRRIAVSGLIKAGPAAKDAWPQIHAAWQKAAKSDRDALAEALLRIDADAAEKEGITWETLPRFEKCPPPPKK